MKDKLKFLLRWAVGFVICFFIIYLFVFFGGWQLFESNDPILIEIGVAFIISIFAVLIYEIVAGLEKRIKSLEEKVNRLEEEIANRQLN